MGMQVPGFLGRIGLAQVMRRWAGVLASPDTASASDLRAMQGQMRGLRNDLARMAGAAQSALLQRTAAVADGILRPDQCQWVWRPDPWARALVPRGQVGVASPTKLAPDVTLFHDANAPDLTIRQEPARDPAWGARFGIVMEVYRFDGSFLSLVHDLPAASLQELTRDHFVSVQLRLDLEEPLEVYARLNVRHGPNTEQIVRQFALKDGVAVAEFDLAYTKINDKRLDKMWLDLIFEGPSMNRIALWDMTMLHAPRADL